ncbi:sulfatase-like hydrolase/transferase [Xylanivirga thermophila]|uniref:sulfatase-like hydrolase/transferase n=1 Tax=Xylanivirga thermophila TaxID=2496273 RepID=UPI00101DF4CD|nr:sulfatase-like hydrolase/transferase [Xylanivirga thermophila]
MKNKRPNIVIFNPDEYRGDVLSHIGNPAAVTPNLDNMVKHDGVSFSNAFCQNPVCTPSRCSFMSGWYPHVRGHRTMYNMMGLDEPVLLKRLKDNGYFVWWGGKNDLIPGDASVEPYCDIRYRLKKPIRSDLHRLKDWRGDPEGDNYYSFYAGKLNTDGEDRYYDSDWANIEGAIDFIHNAPAGKPFCINLALSYPHPPYAVEEPWYSMIDREKLPLRIPTPEGWIGKPSMLKGIHERQNLKNWTEEQWTDLRATYYGMCARIDYQLGLVIDALKKTGQYDNTAIFFFSDHGDFAGDYGLVEKNQNSFEDVLTRVPFVIKPPKWIEVVPGVRDTLVELVDFVATVEELIGMEPDYTHFGKSLIPVIIGEINDHRDAVFCEGGRMHGERHCMEFESSSSQNPEGLYWPRVNLQSSEGPEHTKAIMCRTKDYKYVKRFYEKDELYDLKNDPQELHNIIYDPRMKEILFSLKERLLDFYMSTCDVVPHKTDRR